MINVNEVVPYKAAVKSHFEMLYKYLRQKPMEYPQDIECINSRADHWKDRVSEASYMTVCIHLYDSFL